MLSLLSFCCLVLVYDGYINDSVGPERLGTRLNNLPHHEGSNRWIFYLFIILQFSFYIIIHFEVTLLIAGNIRI